GSRRHSSAALTTSDTVSTIEVKPAFCARKAATASSLAALYTAGTHPPIKPASRASSTAGNALLSNGSKVQVAALLQSHGADAPGSRSGQVSASAMGSRMSGGLAWAIVEPSVNRTIEWTIDCGCTTTSMRS